MFFHFQVIMTVCIVESKEHTLDDRNLLGPGMSQSRSRVPTNLTGRLREILGIFAALEPSIA